MLRVGLEVAAESELGVNAPWKKNRGRPNKGMVFFSNYI